MPVLHSVNVKAGIFYGSFSGCACRWRRNAMPDYDSGYIRESGRKTTDDVRNDFSVAFLPLRSNCPESLYFSERDGKEPENILLFHVNHAVVFPEIRWCFHSAMEDFPAGRPVLLPFILFVRSVQWGHIVFITVVTIVLVDMPLYVG